MKTTKPKHPYNVVWVLVDSVRTYKSNADDRDRLDMMDAFGEGSVEMLDTIASAVSTVMSVSSMQTSLPAYYVSRNYDSFVFDTTYFTTLNQVLKESGYHVYGLFQPVEVREKLQGVVEQLDRKYWPKECKYDAWITNEQFNEVLENIVKKSDLKKPSYIYFHYNCRLDPKTSDIVQSFLDRLETLGYTEDNTIFILCSDHGYPDPTRGFSPEEFHRRNLTHDIHLTDDNIRVPLFVKYPGCPQGKKIKTTTSLMDIVPTILDVLGFDLNEERFQKFEGHSLKPLIENDDDTAWKGQKVRVDNRFLAQTGRCTAVRGSDHKYIYHHDTGMEEFFDLKNDEWELKNLTDSKEVAIQEKLKEYRAEFKEQEKRAVEFQFNHVLKRFMGNFKHKGRLTENPRLLIMKTCSKEYLEMITRIANHLFEKPHIEFFKKDDNPEKFKKQYEVILIPFDNQTGKDYKEMHKIAKKLKAKEILPIDYNMNFYKSKGEVARYMERLYLRRYDYVRRPWLLWSDFVMYSKKAIGLFRLKVLGENWDFKEKEKQS